MLDQIRRWLRYNVWANREVLKSLSASAPTSALKRMAHIAAAEGLWLDRIAGKTTGAVWPDQDLEKIGEAVAAVESRWRELLQEVDEPGLARKVQYKNSKGEPWASSVADVVQHVVFHSAYHRGQIASDLRAAGKEPAYTDFIHAVRQGFID
jgi:uncharacterized damage-inducible protein DinB